MFLSAGFTSSTSGGFLALSFGLWTQGRRSSSKSLEVHMSFKNNGFLSSPLIVWVRTLFSRDSVRNKETLKVKKAKGYYSGT